MIDISRIDAAKDINIIDVAIRLGLSDGKAILRCPFHEEKTPSFRLGWHNRFHCFGCEADGSTIDLVKRFFDFDLDSAVKWLLGTTKLALRSNPKVPSEAARYIHPQAWHEIWRLCEVGDFLSHKGLNANTFGVRRITKEAHALIPEFPVNGFFIPYWQNGHITYARWRNPIAGATPRFMGAKNVPLRLYGQPSLVNLPGPLYIGESETDAMTHITLGQAVICFPGTGSVTSNQLLKLFMLLAPVYGPRITEIVLAFDNDIAGDKAAKSFADFIDLAIKIPYRRLNLGGYKDVNEAFNNGHIIS